MIAYKDYSDTVAKESIKHYKKNLPQGGMVLVLNTEATIDPESEAMLQALHSRSIGGIASHLKVLAERGPEKFLSTYYVGYGHKSIGDCGTTTIFVEGVSMLAAKAIQDWPLYSGQEASTRYIDFAKQNFIDPLGTKTSKTILENWREFYLKGLKELDGYLKNKFPMGEKENEKIYIKAINARAFDIMRGFLPAGASTNLAWHTNFRQAADHIMRLRHHPLEEVRQIAETVEATLKEAHPSSFGHERFNTTEKFNEGWMRTNYYYEDKHPKDFELSKNLVDKKALSKYKLTLKTRPSKTELPKEFSEYGTLQFKFLLDFGSFRDIQRHRAVTQRMPLVVMSHGFDKWYLKELPIMLRKEAEKFLTKQESLINKLKCSPQEKQYYIAMGYRLPNRLTGALSPLLYLAELRATRFVHPTLRKRAIQIAQTLLEEFGSSGLTLHLDDDPDRFDIKRGSHDIVKKS